MHGFAAYAMGGSYVRKQPGIMSAAKLWSLLALLRSLSYAKAQPALGLEVRVHAGAAAIAFCTRSLFGVDTSTTTEDSMCRRSTSQEPASRLQKTLKSAIQPPEPTNPTALKSAKSSNPKGTPA